MDNGTGPNWKEPNNGKKGIAKDLGQKVACGWTEYYAVVGLYDDKHEQAADSRSCGGHHGEGCHEI